MRVLDLFSGMGGFGSGFNKFFDVETAIDIDDDSVLTYDKNHTETENKTGRQFLVIVTFVIRSWDALPECGWQKMGDFICFSWRIEN